MRDKLKVFLVTLIFGVLAFQQNVEAEEMFEVTAECTQNQKVTIGINVTDGVEVAGFDIYRTDTLESEFQYIGTVGVADEYYENDFWEDYYSENIYYDYVYTDETVLTAYQNYYYRIEAYQYVENVKSVIQTSDVVVFIKAAAPIITYGKRVGKLGARIKWTKDNNADGYLIYCVQNYDKKSNRLDVNIYDESAYKIVKTIKKKTTSSNKFTKLMNGVTYTYRVCSYKMIDGERVVSMMSEPKSITMDYYSYDDENNKQKTKRAFGSEKNKNKNFKTAAKASKQMKTIKIKVWDFKNGKKGKKVTRTKYLTVNKRLAPSIKAMFDEIYKSKEKQVIHDIGCYSYRTGEHMYGMAIDINANENYMIDGQTILAGSFWNPKKSKYSIPLKCETVRIMERYGFSRGFWGDRKDYMHFSYFGT